MSDEVQPGAEETVEPNEQAGTAQSGENQEHQQDEKTFDAQYVKKLRDEAAKYRTQLREAEKRLQVLEAAQQSSKGGEESGDEIATLKADIERLRKDEERWNTERRDYELRFAVATAAPKKSLDAKLAVRLLDPGAVEFDESGKPVNVDALLDALVEEYPYLAQSGGGYANPTNPPKPRKGVKLTREEIERMTPEEINRRWEEVSAVLSG